MDLLPEKIGIRRCYYCGCYARFRTARVLPNIHKGYIKTRLMRSIRPDLQVHPDLMRPSRLNGYLRHAQFPIKGGRRHNRHRSSCSNVGLNRGHSDHALSAVRVPTDWHVNGGVISGVTHAYRDVRFSDLQRERESVQRGRTSNPRGHKHNYREGK